MIKDRKFAFITTRHATCGTEDIYFSNVDKETVRGSRWSVSKSRYFEALRNLPPSPPSFPPR